MTTISQPVGSFGIRFGGLYRPPERTESERPPYSAPKPNRIRTERRTGNRTRVNPEQAEAHRV
jgi:hypothetical protein